MRFTDGREKLEIEIHEGQHSWDTTVGFFDHLTAPIVNGTRQAGNVRTLLTNVYNRILGMSGYLAPEADTRAIYTITDLAGNIVGEGFFRFVRQSGQHVLHRLRLSANRRKRESVRGHRLVR